MNMNGFVLVRQFNANNNEWEVAIYTATAYQKVLHWKENGDLSGSVSPPVANGKPHKINPREAARPIGYL